MWNTGFLAQHWFKGWICFKTSCWKNPGFAWKRLWAQHELSWGNHPASQESWAGSFIVCVKWHLGPPVFLAFECVCPLSCVGYSSRFLLRSMSLDLIDCSHQKPKLRKVIIKEDNLGKALFRSVKSFAMLAIGSGHKCSACFLIFNERE